MAGFAIDVYADREVDKDGPRAWPINPISTGMMSAKAAERGIEIFVAAGLFFCVSVHPLTLLPAFALLGVFWGLANGTFDGPLGRMVTMGLLQALYVLLAAAATGTFPAFMIMIAIVLLAAMSGARVVADIRDLPSDIDTDTVTLAKAYGIEKSKWILPLTMTTAFGLGLALYPLSPFDFDYVIWTVAGFGMGLVLAWVFVFNPTPNLAFKLGLPFWGAGILYMVALYLGGH
jgi:4-hydroxybenzoate polyprenyltransferase